jgi:hypothetical protein
MRILTFLAVLLTATVATADTRTYRVIPGRANTVRITNRAFVPRSNQQVIYVLPQGPAPRYARTQGRLSTSEWGRLHAPKIQSASTGTRGTVRAYSGPALEIRNPFVKTSPRPSIKRVANPDGSETVHNPYCE